MNEQHRGSEANTRQINLTELHQLLADGEDKSLLDHLASSRLEKWLLRLAILACMIAAISFVLFALRISASAKTFGVWTSFFAVTLGLLNTLSLARRNILDLFRTASQPFDGLLKAGEKIASAVEIIAKSSRPALEFTLMLVRFKMERIRNRSRFLVGIIEHVGLVPLAIIAWWTWRTQGPATSFSQFEFMGLAFAFGIYGGSLLAFSTLEDCRRIEIVLLEALRLKTPLTRMIDCEDI